MNRRYKQLGIIAAGVAFVIIGFNAITQAIEADINNSLALSQARPQLVSDVRTSAAVKLIDDGIDRQRCAPAGHGEASAMGEEQGTHGLYQIWWYQENDGRFYREVSLAFGSRCGVAYSEQFDEAITNRVPLSIARALTVQFYQTIAEEAGGLEAYRVQLLSSFIDSHQDDFVGPGESISEHTSSKIEVNSVDDWALRQLGIYLPAEAVTIMDIDDAWEYEYEPAAI